MKKFLYVLSLFLLLIGSFLAGSWYKQREVAKVNPSGVKSSAVNTDVRSNTGTVTDTNIGTSSLPPGTVKVTPEKQQLIGVRVAELAKTGQTGTVRAYGRVVADENRTHRLVAPSEGWVRELYGGTTGTLVKKDQVLATYYSRDIISTLVGFYLALGTSEQNIPPGRQQAGVATSQLRTAEANLLTLGMSQAQIEELKRTRQPIPDIEIRSPVSGFVLARNLSPSLRFDRNTELYRIADLSQVWVLADLYENEARYVKPGSKIRIMLPYDKKPFQGTVSDVLPQVDAATRTLKVRLEVENPEYILRPDMFVDVEFPVKLPSALTVPADAILDSGLKKTVFVDRGNGLFEPREVETGWRLGDRIEITKGLKPGERIVVSGNFMIDSESRLEMAAAGMYGTLNKDPVCGVDVSINKAEKTGRKSTYQGKTYYFTSDECKQKFDNNPGVYVKE